MSLAVPHETTVPAYPLGRPLDGRARYGMTPEQAIVYRWLVKVRPHDDEFRINFRELARTLVCGLSNADQRVNALVERGWLMEHGRGVYSFVAPVMHFKGR